MAVKYTIPFVNINDEQFIIEISNSSYNGNSVELTAGTNPITVDYVSNDYLYAPLRFAGATIQIVGNTVMQDLYSNNYQQYKVNLYKNSILIFTGYIVPEAFNVINNGFDEYIEIECISALATLEYVKYDKGTDDIVTLFDLVKSAVIASGGDYKYMYVPMSWDIMFEGLKVSTANFYDEENIPMTYKEILSEICKLYGFTVTEKNGNIYFIDCDYIKNRRENYLRYSTSQF
jgi:hypothetical protein